MGKDQSGLGSNACEGQVTLDRRTAFVDSRRPMFVSEVTIRNLAKCAAFLI